MKSPATADPIDIHVGAAIRSRRLELRMSQNTLAQLAGVTFQQVQKYERAGNRVSASMLVHIAEALDVDAASLLPPPRKTEEERAAWEERVAASPQVVNLLRAVSAMRPEHWAAVTGLLKSSPR